MAQILPEVKPGDLITAADWNAIVEALNSALERIDALEHAGQGGTGLAVTQLIPTGPYRIGDTLEVIGRDFQFSIGATRVYINATQVLSFSQASTDAMLQFVIPDVPGVSEAGTSVDLAIFNQSESVSQSITLRPRQNPLQGNVTLEYLSVDPATVTADQAAIFTYRIQSGTNNRATWLITPAISGTTNDPQWNSQLTVVDAGGHPLGSSQLTLDPGEQANFGVRIDSVPSGSDGTDFALGVNAQADGISGSSGVRHFTVGTADVPPDSTITLALQPALSGGALVGSTLTVPSGSNRTLAIAATFTVAGTYNITLNLLGGASGWNTTPDATPGSYTISSGDLAASGQAQRLMRYTVAATSGATQNAQLEVQVQRAGQTAFRSVIVTLVSS